MKKIHVLFIFGSLQLGMISLLQWIDLKPAMAQTTAESNNESRKDAKKQTLSFEDELVQGSTQKPELFFLFQKKNFNYKRLIRLRDNFLPEMRRSSEDIHRQRSPSE